MRETTACMSRQRQEAMRLNVNGVHRNSYGFP